jgi:amino acid adenylation domain-containing protein
MEHLLHQLIQASAKSFPDRVAVEDGDRQMTYADLETRSNRLASLLRELGVGRGDRVGLFLEKSIDAVVGIYGILKCGGVYVPLDPAAPTQRLGYIASDCGLRVLISSSSKEAAWRELVSHGAPLDVIVTADAENPVGSLVDVRVTTAKDIDRQEPIAPNVGGISLDLAYILYTSGSTGRPKGVMLSHQNALTFVRWAVETFEVGENDRLSNHAPLHFDLSVFDLYAAAMAGATVVLVPQALSVFPVQVRDFIEGKRITIWYSVPSILSMLTLRGGLRVGRLPDLRIVLFAGEVFPTKYLRSLMELLPRVGFYNLYGPTETNVCTWYHVPQLSSDATEPIPIGQAIDDVEVFAVREDGALAAVGDVGELLVRGDTVMRGYWGDPDRSARGLVPDPRGSVSRDTVYRTGDLVRLRADGNCELVGRRDHQVKSRGYRIELGDIEVALYSHPDVIECAAVAVPDPLVTNRIVAFVTARNGLLERDLAKVASQHIPHYMLPERIDFVDELPKTSTGKIDRRSLTASTAARTDGEVEP